MKRCSECNEFACGGWGTDAISPYCGGNTIVKEQKSTDKKQPEPITNKERIRKMGDRELAEFLYHFQDIDNEYIWSGFCDVCRNEQDCVSDCMMDWLNASSEAYGGIDHKEITGSENHGKNKK